MFSFDPKHFKFNIFSDSDGVTYNMAGHWEAMYGKPWESFHPDWCWEQVTADPQFFEKIPLLEHASAYWELVSPFGPIVLTGCPKSCFDDAAASKRRAWKRDFNVDEIITCLAKNKSEYMVKPGDILIDDWTPNIKRWRKAGGTGILFRDFETFAEEFIATVEALQLVT